LPGGANLPGFARWLAALALAVKAKLIKTRSNKHFASSADKPTQASIKRQIGSSAFTKARRTHKSFSRLIARMAQQRAAAICTSFSGKFQYFTTGT